MNLLNSSPRKPRFIGVGTNGSFQKFKNLFVLELQAFWGCLFIKPFSSSWPIINKLKCFWLFTYFSFSDQNIIGNLLSKKLNFHLLTILILFFNSALAQNIQVSGAGSTQANGIYEVTGENQGKASYTKIGDPTMTIVFNDYWEIREAS